MTDFGQYQLEWLNKYEQIDLTEWRCEIIDNKKDWYYVGNWKPSEIKPYPSKQDGGYRIRYNNLVNNPYFYWPKC